VAAEERLQKEATFQPQITDYPLPPVFTTFILVLNDIYREVILHRG
jgi:hypothetical protein